MKFQLAINMERMHDGIDMKNVARHTLEMVQMADAGGFRVAWAAEHHALEMTIAPNPFQILTWWASHTSNIRLGSAVAVAAYWNPINLASEAALLDLLSDGRLEFGIGSGAYQREFDRMHPGLKQTDAYRYVHEMLPTVKALWQGDCEHNGEFWNFPTATSVPKPLQQPHPPIWVAARAPVTFDYAVANGCNIISWPLTRPMDEVDLYKQRLDQAVESHGAADRPSFAVMRHTAVYEDTQARDSVISAIQLSMGMFQNLFFNLGDVVNGFPKQIPIDKLKESEQYDAQMLEQNLMLGSPYEVIDKLKQYEAAGVDEFVYLASMGLGHEQQKRSLRLFCDEVIPKFQ